MIWVFGLLYYFVSTVIATAVMYLFGMSFIAVPFYIGFLASNVYIATKLWRRFSRVTG